MRTLVGNWRLWVLVPAVFVCCAVVFSCFSCNIGITPFTSYNPPASESVMSSWPDTSFFFYKWKEGATILLVNNNGGDWGHGGGMSSRDPFYKEYGDFVLRDARGFNIKDGKKNPGYKWTIETKDGKTVTFKIDGKEYDLSKGELFVTKVKGEGEPVEVHQLKRDLSAIPFEINKPGKPGTADKCQDYLKKDAEVMKLLGAGDLPK
jgi:hypothetical protein